MRRSLSRLLILAVLAAGHLDAGTTGKVRGRVTDNVDGEPLIGVNVLLEGTNLGAATDLDGYYVILNVPPGKYNLIASSMGYGRKMVKDISVSVDLTTTVDVTLESAVVDLGDVVIITAESKIIRKDLTSSESRVTSDQISNLPVQEIGEILSLQAGVTVGKGGEIHIRGGRSSEVAYWVDGISISDGFDGSQSVQVDNNAIQELQVISGTFNAEYGQAMSGIVNIVTKDGGQDLRGSISLYGGDYITSGPSFFPNLSSGFSNVTMTRNANIEGSLSGPIPFFNDMTFYGNARYYKGGGHLYGIRRFNPDGSAGDGAAVPMNTRDRISGQGKVSYNFAPTMKITLSGIGSDVRFRDYGHDWKYNPDGDVKKYDLGWSLSGTWTHTLSSSSFYTVNVSHFYKRFKEYLYTDPFDPRYEVDPTATNRDLYEFLRRGTNNHRFRRTTTTDLIKGDYTNQITRLHQLKLGIEAKFHELFFDDFSLVPVQINDSTYVPMIPELNTPLRHQYLERPVEFSGYVQDKLEFDQMIVNIGLRFDYFDSKGRYPADLQDPNVYLPQKPGNQALTLEQRLAKWFVDAEAKYSFSPRLGISYPITDQGVLHFSYGHFLQIPTFSHLYQQPDYKVTTASGLQGVFGNPNLDPQRTVMYEFGLQQQISEDISFDVTGFYRDTRDWVSTSAVIPVRDLETATSFYTIFVNRDYANTRGLTLWLNKRPTGLLYFNLSYTFQVAEGINSAPDEEQGALARNDAPSQYLVPLDWDQTHTLNFSAGITGADWGLNFLGRYGSGLPYSPALNQAEGRGEDASRALQKNSRRQPPMYTFDLHAFKSFHLALINATVFVKVYNVLDRRNETTVYGQTGRAFASVRSLGAEPVNQNPNRINSVEEYIVRPDFYSEPREIQIGFELSF
ncbi:MAG: TonB-dependent receptor [Bacteroidota bacterium]